MVTRKWSIGAAARAVEAIDAKQDAASRAVSEKSLRMRTRLSPP
jgi:hypothetical protein